MGWTAFFLLGFTSQLIQMLLLKYLWISFFGQEIFLTLAFATWLLFSTLGVMAGTLLGWYLSSFKWISTLLFLFFALLFFLPLVILLSPIFFKIPRGQPLSLSHLVLVCLVTLGPSAFGINFFFPLFLKDFTSILSPPESYGFEALGALLGGLGFTFLLLYFPFPLIWSLFAILWALYFFKLEFQNKGIWSKAFSFLFLGLGSILLLFSFSIENK